LTVNVRTSGLQDKFAKWLLDIGDGVLSNDAGLDSDFIKIPAEMVEQEDIVHSIFGDRIDPDSVHTLADSYSLP
jgi:hypothetical protein